MPVRLLSWTSAERLLWVKAAPCFARLFVVCWMIKRIHIVLNLGDVDYIDSSGIGELVSAYTTAKGRGGELKLLHLTKKVHDLLQLTKLYTVFDVYTEESAALNSFQ